MWRLLKTQNITLYDFLKQTILCNTQLLFNHLIMSTKDYDHEILTVESIDKDFYRFFSPFSYNLPLVSLPHIVLLSAQIFFSGWHIIGHITLWGGSVNPFIFALYRELISSAMMYFYVQYKEIKVLIDPKDFGTFFFLGVCSFTNVVSACSALQFISATRFAILQPSVPCIATIIAIAFNLEKFSFQKVFGVCFAVVGALVVVLSQTSDHKNVESHVFFGTMIVLLQVTAMANLLVFQKPLLAKYDPSIVTFTYYSTGTALTLVLCLLSAPLYMKPSDLYFNNNTMPWFGLVYATTFATLYSYNALSWAGKQLSPSTTAVFCTFQPVSTMILSLVIFGVAATMSEAIGAVLVVVGLVVTVSAKQAADE